MTAHPSKGLTVRPVPEEEDASWDAFVDASPTGNRFLRSDCLRMLEQTDSVGIRFERLGAFASDGTLRGAWALPYAQRFRVRASTYFELFYAGPMLAPELESGSVHEADERLEVLHGLAEGHGKRMHLIEAEAHPRFRDARGIRYAGWTLQTRYTHIWDFESPEELFGRMNRERRRLIRRAQETYEFAPEPPETAIRDFTPVYRALMKKFDWFPSRRWERDLSARLDWLQANGVAGVYGARDASGVLQAAVVVLLSPQDHTVYLWRCGYDEDAGGNSVIPALYWNACLHWREQWGTPFYANLGGSPHYTLALFKDYLGAKVVPHLRLVYHRPGVSAIGWRAARKTRYLTRCALARARKTLASPRS